MSPAPPGPPGPPDPPVDTQAACLVIGDEILTGKIHEQNAHTLSKVLFERGVQLRRIEVIPDDVDEIARSVRALSSRFDLVFTSGGIGPTHDDVTYEGVARGMGRTLLPHDDTVARMQAFYAARPDKLNDARLRMATLPQPCEVWSTDGLWVPLVVVDNVHILPGIPQLFAALLEAHKHRFEGRRRHRVVLWVARAEGDIAKPLAAIAARFADVAIGSYPQVTDNLGPLAQLTFEGADAAATEAAAAEAAAALGATPESPHGPRRSET